MSKKSALQALAKKIPNVPINQLEFIVAMYLKTLMEEVASRGQVKIEAGDIVLAEMNLKFVPGKEFSYLINGGKSEDKVSIGFDVPKATSLEIDKSVGDELWFKLKKRFYAKAKPKVAE